VSYSFRALVQLPRVLGFVPSSGPTEGGTLLRIVGKLFRFSGEVFFVEVDDNMVRSSVRSRCEVVEYSEEEIK
jgi:hypothetical protein